MMKIKSLRLENIKSYIDETFTFSEGVNFISGVNGAGKSTIIESIGYALFDSKQHTNEEFVRYGARTGVITVHFEANDGREYRVVRKVGANTSWQVFDVEFNDELNLHGSADIKPWLKKIMGIDTDIKLEQLFKDVVGVSQGEFTTPFIMSESPRKQHFNAIFKVDSYLEAFEKTRSVVSALTEIIHKNENTRAGLAASISEYDKTKEDLQNIEKSIKELTREYEIKNREMQEKNEACDKQKKLKSNLEQIDNEIKILNAHIENIKETIIALQGEIKAAKEAEQKTLLNKDGFNKYLEAKNNLQALNNERAKRDILQRQENEITTKTKTLQAELKTQTENLNTQKKELAEEKIRKQDELKQKEAEKGFAEQRLQATEKLNQTHNTFKTKLKELENLYQEQVGLRNRLQNGREKWEELKKEILKTNNELSRKNDIILAFHEFEKAEKNLQELRQKIAALRQREKTLRENQERTKDGLCPFLESECKNVGGNLSEYFVSELKAVQEKLISFQLQEKELEKWVNDEQERRTIYLNLQNIEKTAQEYENKKAQYFKTFEKLFAETMRTDVLEITKQIIKQADTLQQNISTILENYSPPQSAYLFKEELQNMTDAWQSYAAEAKKPFDFEYLQFILDLQDNFLNKVQNASDVAEGYWYDVYSALNNLAQERNKAYGVIANASDTLKSELRRIAAKEDEIAKSFQKLQEKKHELEKLIDAREKILAELEKYADLDEKIETAQERMQKFEEAYQVYLKNEQVAKKLPELEKNYSEKQQELTEKEQQRTNLVKEEISISALFEPHKLELLEKEIKELAHAVGGINASIQERKREKGVLAEKLFMMDKTKEELKKVEAEIAKYNAVKTMLDYFRSVYNRAGQKVADVYRKHLAEEANRLYNSVSNEKVALEWQEDYNITLRDNFNGKERIRNFKQLSGGEQMTAALAVRLALLGQLSSIRIGFFDEPTTNLDVERRANLARIIPEITGDFNQIFVISHDDSFDAMTENVIELVKDSALGTKKA